MTCYTPNIPHEKEPSPRWQSLADHLRHGAGLARGFAQKARPGDKGFAGAACAVVLWHGFAAEDCR